MADRILVPQESYRVLQALDRRGGEATVDEIARELSVEPSALMRPLAELERMGLVTAAREEVREAEVSDEGKRYAERGLPELRVLRLLADGMSVEEAKSKAAAEGLEEQEFRLGLMHLLRSRVARIEEGRVRLDESRIPGFVESRRRLQELLRRGDGRLEELAKAYSEALEEARRRKLIRVRTRRLIRVSLSEGARRMLREGRIQAAEVVTRLTPELIRSGRWREVIIKPFDLSVPVPVVYPGRKHPYMEFLDQIREILISMGFEEMKGPHVELEFWNFDVLFQAQDHPAREIHDTFYLEYPREGEVADKELFERVRRVHEDGWITGSRGWRYRWDPRRALRLILRTQTTSVSARTLRLRGDGVYKAFALDRNFRPEALDATHSMEFYQCEGIVVGPRLNFRHLLGFLAEFSRRLGLEKVKFKPAYFPFTEPSVEGYVYHPKLGWIEALPGGMFRPEVLAPLGITYRVLAWGIGIDRLAMVVLGIDDIRDLFTPDLSKLRRMPAPGIPGLLR